MNSLSPLSSPSIPHSKPSDLCHFPKTALATYIALACLSFSQLAQAETVTYDGTGQLQTCKDHIMTFNNAVAPGGCNTDPSNTNASGNTVTMQSGTDPDYVFGAFRSNATAVSNNEVTFNDGEVLSVYGGYSESSDATGNTSNVTGGTITKNNYGGYSRYGSATENEVSISGGTITENNYGGYVRNGSGNANQNKVNISDNSTINGSSHGGRSWYGNANQNEVNITGGTINYNYGGWSHEGNTNNNSVTISGGIITRSNYGGDTTTGNAENNSVSISGGTITKNNYGGYSRYGSATENEVSISGGTITENNYGGYVRNGSGNATGNTTTISGSATVGGSNYGGYVRSGGSGNATGNTTNINGGTIDYDNFGGWSESGAASDNTVNISGGTIKGDVGGGSSESGSVSENKVNIQGGTIEGDIAGGSSGSGNANHNTVTISGGTIRKVSGGAYDYTSIYGGVSDEGDATVNANHNTVTISGGIIEVDTIFGGVSDKGNTINNTITIKKGANGNPTFGDNTWLYGGYGSGNDVESGNTLSLHTTGITVKNIDNFKNLHFYVQVGTPAGATFLTLKDGTDIGETKVGVALEGSDSLLHVGDEVTLIHTQNGQLLTDDENLNNTVTGMQGIAVEYQFELEKKDNKTLIARAAGGFGTGGTGETAGSVHPQTKSLLESGLSGVDFVNRGADLAHTAGIQQLLQLSANDGIKAFGAIGGGKYRTETGSHIDVKGVNLLLGAGKNLSNQAGQLYLGAYVEGGIGSYNSFNNFANRPSVRGDGNSKYYGLGAILRQDFSNNVFIKGGLHFGKSHTTYNSNDLLGAGGNPVHFKTKRSYAGFNIGAGYHAHINDKITITPSVNVLYTHFGKANEVIQGSTFNFDSIRSLRTQLGAKLNYQLSDKADLYTSLVWEREHKGDAKGSVSGLDMPTPSVKGNTGIVEVGANFTPNKNLTINVGAAGSFGKRRGGEANIGIKYDF
ncbi:MAG: hypothetical protein CSA47_02060 [Gammaproteobacteria bacterium]|nr:MAG: hypothetical protein CSA47_02060 [Gammaproteobacteria bacterium]